MKLSPKDEGEIKTIQEKQELLEQSRSICNDLKIASLGSDYTNCAANFRVPFYLKNILVRKKDPRTTIIKILE